MTLYLVTDQPQKSVNTWLRLSERQLEIHFYRMHPGKESRARSANDRNTVQGILSLLRAAFVKAESGIWFPCYEVIVIVYCHLAQLPMSNTLLFGSLYVKRKSDCEIILMSPVYAIYVFFL